MLNAILMKTLTDMADLLELNGDNPFRIRAFRRAIDTVEGHSVDFSTMSRDERLEVAGIGKGIADLIEEVEKTGRVAELEKLRKKFPSGVLDVMRQGGLGPKRAAILFKELRIDSLPKLAAAAGKGAIKNIDGFGEKIQANILKSLAAAHAQGPKRLLISDARKIAEEMAAYLRRSPQIDQLVVAGSSRRWKETIGDLDFLCTSVRPERAIAHFCEYAGKARILASGKTKASIVLQSGLQVDFRVVDAASYGAALLYFTGSKSHNVRLRELALKRGYSLNEYGLFKINDEQKKRPVAGRTEEEIYKKLGMPFIPPELREDRGEIDAALANKLPKLIEESDVLGDFHNHTKLSDGVNTLEQMVDAAKSRGWKWFFSADHSPSLKIASGLPVEVLKKKMDEVKKLDKASRGFRVYTSSEVDILADGSMDYPEDVLASLDCVVASVHSRFKQTTEEMTERICRAVRHPNVDILGHISGRKLNVRESYGLDYETVFEEARRHGTAIEINGQPERQELADIHVKRAIEIGVPLALNTDAHSTSQLEHMTLAVHIARRGWAEAKNILNTRSAEEVTRWLRN